MPSNIIDVHQHLWPAELVEQLRRRSTPPRLEGWTLHTLGEAPFLVDPDRHDVRRRSADVHGRAFVSLSTPLGIEALPVDEATPLLDAWHRGASELPEPFGAWSAVCEVDPDLDALRQRLAEGFVGLQVSASWLATPSRIETAAAALEVCARADAPVLVHPGSVSSNVGVPAWWPALVDYPAQLQAAWWAWHEAGRVLLPSLRICFAAGGGLAPVQAERFTARSGRAFEPDPDVFVDTSSHGPKAVGALIAALGPDALVLGSDRPYAEPLEPSMVDEQTWTALAIDNPARLLTRATASFR